VSNNKEVRFSAPKQRVYCFTHIFFHPDYNRWSRSCTESADAERPVADYTASGEFHPALKTFFSIVFASIIADPPQNAIPFL